jgi:hypothetical protein
LRRHLVVAVAVRIEASSALAGRAMLGRIRIAASLASQRRIADLVGARTKLNGPSASMVILLRSVLAACARRLSPYAPPRTGPCRAERRCPADRREGRAL